MKFGVENKASFFVRFILLIIPFCFQLSIVSVSANPVILDQSHHTGILETYTCDAIESPVSAKVGLTGGLSRVLSIKEVRPDYEVLADVASVAAKGSKAIVIGEGMGAVKTTAKTLQSQGINAKWYQAWSKNFPTNRLMTPAELSAAQARNARWLNTKINQGYKIYDIGIDATRATRSPFYQLERSILQQRGYPTTIIPR